MHGYQECHNMKIMTCHIMFDFRSLMKQLFLAVEHMHRHNVTHRDLKPENILLNKDEVLKISNFWFAKVVNDGELLTSESAFTNIYSSKSHMKSSVFLHVFDDISTYVYVFTEYFLHSFSNLSIEFQVVL